MLVYCFLFLILKFDINFQDVKITKKNVKQQGFDKNFLKSL